MKKVIILSLEKKAKQLVKLTDKQEKALIRQLQKQYSTSLIETRKAISEAYSKYSDDGILTYAEMQKYNRLVALEKNIVDELNSLYADTGKELRLTLSNMYQDSYLFTGFSLETEAQQKLAFSLLPKEQIAEAIQNPISGLTLNERLINNRRQIIIKTREQLTQGLIQGESISKMARRIKDVYEGDLNKSVRIARTETNRVRNAGTIRAYEKAEAMGLEFDRVWVATLDSRTRDSHGALDGQKADKDGLFHINGLSTKAPGQFGVASEDINCRCTTRAKLKNIDSIEERRIKGEDEPVPYKTYNEWLESKGLPKKDIEVEKLDKIAKIQFKPATTHKEAEEYAVDKLGFEKASTKGLDLEMVNANNEAITLMYNRYPDLQGTIKELKVNNAKTEYGKHTIQIRNKDNKIISADTTMVFSKQSMGDVATFKDAWIRDLKDNFHPVNVTDIKAIAIHESTHALEWQLINKKYANGTAREIINGINSGEISREIKMKALENLDLLQPGKNQYDAVKDLGRYSMVNSKEFLAEAMTDALLSPNPLPISQEVLKLVDEMSRR